MRSWSWTIVLTSSVLLSGCIKTASVPPAEQPKPMEQRVDLARYMGTWYEIAAYPNRFERDCQCSMAEYRLDGDVVRVTNSCLRGSSQRLSQVTGKGFPVAGSNNTKLQVQFFWPFRGDYWILALDKDYRYSLVGSPDRDYLWILARTRSLSEPELLKLKQYAKQLGYDPEKLVMTPQQNCLPIRH